MSSAIDGDSKLAEHLPWDCGGSGSAHRGDSAQAFGSRHGALDNPSHASDTRLHVDIGSDRDVATYGRVSAHQRDRSRRVVFARINIESVPD